MIALKALNLQELFAIFDCESVADICQYQDLFDKLDKKKVSLNPLSNALRDSIEIASNPIEMWWAITSLVNVGLALVPLTMVFGITTLVVGGVCYWTSYNDSKLKAKNIAENLQLIHLKLQVADRLIALQEQLVAEQLRCNASMRAYYPLATKADKPTNEEIIPAKIAKLPSLGIALTTTTTLMVSYFWGMTSIIETLGYVAAATAMTGPIGIVVASVCALGIGCYFAYKHYQYQKNKQLIEANKVALQHQLQSKIITCKALNASLKTLTLSNIVHHEHDVPSKNSSLHLNLFQPKNDTSRSSSLAHKRRYSF